MVAPPAPGPVPQGPVHRGVPIDCITEVRAGLRVHRIVRALATDGLEVGDGTICGALKAAEDQLVPREDAIGAYDQAMHVPADESAWRGVRGRRKQYAAARAGSNSRGP
jgi:Transposase IS66 family